MGVHHIGRERETVCPCHLLVDESTTGALGDCLCHGIAPLLERCLGQRVFRLLGERLEDDEESVELRVIHGLREAPRERVGLTDQLFTDFQAPAEVNQLHLSSPRPLSGSQ